MLLRPTSGNRHPRQRAYPDRGFVRIGATLLIASLVAGCTSSLVGTAQTVSTALSSSEVTAPSTPSTSPPSTSPPSTTPSTPAETTPSESASATTTATNDDATTTSEAPSESPTSAPPSSGASADPADAVAIIGPHGWLDLTLGMSAEEAAVLGIFADTPAPEGDSCTSWEGSEASAISSVVLSPNLGVVAILPWPDPALSTPEGISVGATADQVAAEYGFDPADFNSPNGVLAAVPGFAGAHFRFQFDASGVLVSFMLELANQDCYG
jgi:hypothetical protein